MPGTVALLYAVIASLVVGLTVFFSGVIQTVTARRRAAAVRAPMIATGIGLVIVLAAAVTLIAHASVHLTFATYTELR